MTHILDWLSNSMEKHKRKFFEESAKWIGTFAFSNMYSINCNGQGEEGSAWTLKETGPP